MTMNCRPIPTLDERINDIRCRTAEIVNEDILPNEHRLWAARREGESMEHRREVLELRAEIKEKVKKAGLWAPHLPKEFGGMGLDFLAHAYMNEVLAYAIGARRLLGWRRRTREISRSWPSTAPRSRSSDGCSAHRRDDGIGFLDD